MQRVRLQWNQFERQIWRLHVWPACRDKRWHYVSNGRTAMKRWDNIVIFVNSCFGLCQDPKLLSHIENLAQYITTGEENTWKRTDAISGMLPMELKQALDPKSLTSTMQHVATRTVSGFCFPKSQQFWTFSTRSHRIPAVSVISNYSRGCSNF